ncbi:hypothetical protein [Alteribacter populi]|uniref:hypothetical protein n=1 Tax=Alteribacter populi TaxID=2011011 RepID=UPI0012FFC9A1|nr:hypothetical protein [Alteribacter populi]
MSIAMLAIECIFITDKEYKGFKKGLRNIIRRFNLQLKYATRPLRRKHIADSHQLIVFYDGWCPMCQSIIQRLHAIDYLNLISFFPFVIKPSPHPTILIPVWRKKK